MNHLNLRGSAASYCGTRSGNQDNLRFDNICSFIDQKKPFSASSEFSTDTLRIFCVCDGLGGEQLGNLASQAALMGVKEYLSQAEPGGDLADCVFHAAEYADRKVSEMYDRLNVLGGTTMVMIGICGSDFVSLNIGDSPIFWYHRKAGMLEELSERHNEAWEAIRQGKTPPAHGASRLLRCLGQNYPNLEEQVYMRCGTLESGDAVLLCSDGVSEAFSEKTLTRMLKWRRKAASICAKAEKRPDADNCTAICLQVTKGK